jgi:class 3 adenylate cyclase
LAWPDILNAVRDVKVADIHGDFNLENILVDPDARDVRLIDFALARRDHVLHDLLRLETEIVTKLLPEQLSDADLSSTVVCALYRHLHMLMAVDADATAAQALPAALAQPLMLLKALRALARDYLFRRGDWSEYYQGLTLYLLGALKFKNLDRVPSAPLPKQVAFWAAAMACTLHQTPTARQRLGQETFGEVTVRWSQVAAYFPSQHQPDTSESVTLDAAQIDHLAALLRMMMTYLPRSLALDILEQRPLVPGRFLDGTLLFADISGFTALSESLRRKAGEEGAEELVRIINQYLDVMLGILFQHDGELMRFGGDAMLCLFTGTNHGDGAASNSATAAVRAAWAMKQAMVEHFAEVTALQEVFPLSMKVGSHSGQLLVAQVGTAEHKEYVLTGSAVERTAHAESAARRGDILISRETYAQVQISLEVVPLPENEAFLRVVALEDGDACEGLGRVGNLCKGGGGPRWDEVEDSLRALRHQIPQLLHCLETAATYLPTGILSQLALNPLQEQLEGQHRRVTVLFANLIGMPDIISARGTADAAGIASDLNEYFQAMLEEVQYYGGMVNKVDLYDKGDKIIVLFGAPVAHEQDVRRAALTALAIQAALRRLKSPIASALLTQRIGIHTGYVFAGNVGSALCRRREYTVMGDTVNLAARLMSKAPVGHIWVSEPVREQIGAAFEVESLPPVRLKGVSAPTPVYRLHGVRESQITRRSRMLRSDLVGRDAELETLLTLLADSAQGIGKQVVAVVGEAGVGKTRLLMEWRQAAACAFPLI